MTDLSDLKDRVAEYLKPPTCEWAEVNDDRPYEGIRKYFRIPCTRETRYRPYQNSWKHCPWCGKPLKIVEVTA